MLLDHHPSDQEGVVSLIRAQPGFRIMSASAELEEAVRGVQEAKPDIVLLNLRPGNGCLALAGALHGAVPVSRVIIMGVEPEDGNIPDLVRAQVSGFIMADASFEQVLHAIHSVARGVQILPPALTRPLFRFLNPHGDRKRPRRALDMRRLTGRERQVAALIVRGESNRQISVQLRITLQAAKVHVHRILSKLGMSSRVEVASFLQESHWLAGADLLSPPLGLAPIPLL
jgi:DNA-binding NarL/FixJ family response regulator